MKVSDQSLDRLAIVALALLLAVCSVLVIGFIVLAQAGVVAALVASAAMVVVVGTIVLALNRAAGF